LFLGRFKLMGRMDLQTIGREEKQAGQLAGLKDAAFTVLPPDNQQAFKPAPCAVAPDAQHLV